MSDDHFGKPVIVSASGVEALARVPMSSQEGGGYNEDWLQELVFKRPECLPITEIDSTFTPLVPVCRELSTPVGPLDVIYVTPQGRLVLLEAKLWRNPEARRKVVGQILDYAKEISRWSYAELQSKVSQATKRKGNSLFDIVAERYPDVSESQFVDEVTRSLSSGRFLLLIVGDGIREGVGGIADFLEKFASLQFTFGLVELPVYQLADGRRLVQPRVLTKTMIIKRIVVDTNGVAMEAEAGPQAESEPKEISESALFYREFWNEFLEGLSLDDVSQPKANKTGMGNIFFPMPPSGGQSWLTVYFSQPKNEVGVFLTFTKGAFADQTYEWLHGDKESIEREIDSPIEWESDGAKHRISSRKKFPDLRDTRYRGEIKAYFSDTINRFVNVFRPRLTRMKDNYQ